MAVGSRARGMALAVALLALLGVAGLVAAQLQPRPESRVVRLTEKTFRKEIGGSHDYYMVHVHTQWCAACKDVTKIFEDLAEKHVMKARFGHFDGMLFKRLSGNLNATSFPTIIEFTQEREKPAHYRGPLTFEAIDSIVTENSKTFWSSAAIPAATFTRIYTLIHEKRPKKNLFIFLAPSKDSNPVIPEPLLRYSWSLNKTKVSGAQPMFFRMQQSDAASMNFRLHLGGFAVLLGISPHNDKYAVIEAKKIKPVTLSRFVRSARSCDDREFSWIRLPPLPPPARMAVTNAPSNYIEPSSITFYEQCLGDERMCVVVLTSGITSQDTKDVRKHVAKPLAKLYADKPYVFAFVTHDSSLRMGLCDAFGIRRLGKGDTTFYVIMIDVGPDDNKYALARSKGLDYSKASKFIYSVETGQTPLKPLPALPTFYSGGL